MVITVSAVCYLTSQTPQFAAAWNDVDNLPPMLLNFNLDASFFLSGDEMNQAMNWKYV